jgi:hypothetical protein
MTTRRFTRGQRVRLMAPGAMRGTEAVLDNPVSETRWRVIARGGMWEGKPFTAAEDFMEQVEESENASV